jgi:hypothetical protein
MRRLVLVSVIALAACGPKADQRSSTTESLTTYDVAPPAAESGVPAAPGIRVTAAPGVAFDYRYAFKLPAARIAGAQEGHAAACEKLGIARCRITGMRYTLTGENAVEAMLAFKLAPEIARGFGKQGIDLVKAAEGTLVDAAITGTDAGADIGRASTERARAAAELKRLDEQLARSPRSAERDELQRQRDEAQRRIAAAQDAGTTARESLANTPMTFQYGSGPAIRGFDASAPVTSALDTLNASAQVTLAVVLGALAILGPPALVLLLGWLLWRRVRPAWRRLRGAAPAG